MDSAFLADKQIPARWVRLTIKTNHGNSEWCELFSFRGFGQRPVIPEPAEYFRHLFDQLRGFSCSCSKGTALTGCYEYDNGILEGTIEGRVMKITWQEAGGPHDRGPAVMVFSRDGKSFRDSGGMVITRKALPTVPGTGLEVSDEVGGCPHWSGSVGGELKKKLLEREKGSCLWYSV